MHGLVVWDKDTQMEYDTTTRLWTVVTPLLDKGIQI